MEIAAFLFRQTERGCSSSYQLDGWQVSNPLNPNTEVKPIQVHLTQFRTI